MIEHKLYEYKGTALDGLNFEKINEMAFIGKYKLIKKNMKNNPLKSTDLTELTLEETKEKCEKTLQKFF